MHFCKSTAQQWCDVKRTVVGSAWRRLSGVIHVICFNSELRSVGFVNEVKHVCSYALDELAVQAFL